MVRLRGKIIFNVFLFLLLLGATYSWMVTSASSGEIVDYSRRLLISAIDLDVKLYRYVDDQYQLVTEPVIDLSNMAPNDKMQFRFDITNANDTVGSAKILFAGITGDIDILQDKIYMGSTSPKVYEFPLRSRLEYDKQGGAFLRFDDEFKVSPHTTVSLYWYILIDKMASNEIAGKELQIQNITLIKP